VYGGATQTTLQQRALEGEHLAQQARDLSERLTEHDGFRRSLEEKLQQARDALEHYRARPSALASTMRARKASACAVLRPPLSR
jgi:chromosome segregation ATPase